MGIQTLIAAWYGHPQSVLLGYGLGLLTAALIAAFFEGRDNNKEDK
jgi:hypothetical protein